MNARQALCIGKFYPPHLGHLNLVHRATEVAESVTVIVMASSVESIPLAKRVEWMAEALADQPHVVVLGVIDDVPVDYESDAIWGQHVALMHEALATVPRSPVDLVVTAEPYGAELARRFSAQHLFVDRGVDGRSGTRCRSDLARAWGDLIDPARVGLAQRIVVLGAESTGTTTLAHDLAADLSVPFVPEWGRVASVAKVAELRASEGTADMEDVEWCSSDFTVIAAKQQQLIDTACRTAPLVVADTDALATSVWHDRYLGGSHQPALDLAQMNPPALYLLTLPHGVPFDQDGFRDGEDVRGLMTEQFIAALEAQPIPFAMIEGSRRERLEHSRLLIEKFAPLLNFADPLG